MNTILGLKQSVSQKFLEDGTRIPVTFVHVNPNPIIAIKTMDKHGYRAMQIGCEFTKKSLNENEKEGTNKKLAPRFLKEVRLMVDIDVKTLPNVGDVIEAANILKPGDIIDVTGVSKGKGFAGGVKRFHFRGGPRTHGQSDRERAPGSIGQTTTPGRVYRGKRMAGKMGHEQVTVKNLMVVDVTGRRVMVKGVVPGIPESLLIIKKVGEKKKFVPLMKEEVKVAKGTKAAEETDVKAEKEAVV